MSNTNVNDDIDDDFDDEDRIEDSFKKLILMEDKNKASRTVVRNALKFINENGWNSDGWSDGSRVCLVGALLQGAGVNVQDDDTRAEACVIDPKTGKTCQRDEILFKNLPPLKEATKTTLNTWLANMIKDFKVEIKAIEKENGEETDEFGYEYTELEDKLDTAQGAKVSKAAAALAVSQAIQHFNDEILDDEENAVSFLKDLLKAIPTSESKAKVRVTNSKDVK